ncbi:MAG: acylphosphatase [Pseudomonadota bacterium]|jgi:acylphosphatase|nr:acylphosphatase [Pseudomonadota bacterium]MDQ5907058.1 acylphosphatase [Pseudomonadota bacterium]MDQ5916253.1 acylphosphatase [Pseudomonadota bacterium]MDQ5941201.1 acylphosphatase [Pseudomonadota bacterium]
MSQIPAIPAAEFTTLALSIHGRVQGVGFRWSLCEQARALGLTGWVRNRRDGSVEALVRGPAAAVDILVDWSRRGPPAASVRTVEVSPGDNDIPLIEFAQLPTD